MKNRIILFINGFLIWMLLGWPPDMQHLVVGIFVAAFVVFLTGNLFASRPYQLGRITRYLWFGYYVVMFLWECLKANIDVAARVINPRLPINPGIVKIKTSLKSDTALTFLANSITLTPGTFCVDIIKPCPAKGTASGTPANAGRESGRSIGDAGLNEPDEGVLYIHWIDVRTENIEKATQIIAGKFERILKKIFE